MKKPQKLSVFAPIIVLSLTLPSDALGAGPTAVLPGDDLIALSPETQEWVEIAPGGPGYLLVWEDSRPNISGAINSAGPPLSGNGVDIYAAIVDTTGAVLTGPIVVSSEGMDQTRPRAAWNGENWLVVWTTERPNWYFFEDIVGVRISPGGEVLDPVPLPIRPELNNPANNRGENPRLASDGTNWLVVWEDFTFEGFNATLNLSGLRIAPDGTFIDPEPVVLYQFGSIVFGPEDPQIAWATDEYLLVWEEFGDFYSQRFDASLGEIDPNPVHVANSGTDPRLATNGQDFMVISRENRAYRINHAGVPLDGLAGVDFDSINGTGWQPSGGGVAWEGSSWLIVFPSTPSALGNSDLYTVRISSDGNVLPPGATLLVGSVDFEWKPAIGAGPSGGAQIAWSQRANLVPETVRGLSLSAGAAPGQDVDIAVGLPRQTYLRFETAEDRHLAVFVSENDGEARLVAQRVDASGQAIDPEPTRLATFPEGVLVRPDVSFNGSLYLVVWNDVTGSVWGQRLDVNNVLVDPDPVELVSRDAAKGAAIGALGDDFLLAYPHRFSSDIQYLKAVRIDGASLALLDTPFFIGFNYALNPNVVDFGGRWLVLWEDQLRHDRRDSDIAAVWVDAGGNATGSFLVDQGGFADTPDIALAPDRALITWSDNLDWLNSQVEGRIMFPDGTFLGGEFLIAEDNGEQVLPRAAWDGTDFGVAWTDYRSIQGVEHQRADIYAARIALDGTVIDPNGFALTSSPLSEDLPDVAGAPGSVVVAYSEQAGRQAPEVQRLSLQRLAGGMTLSISGTCPGPVTATVSGGEPGSEVAVVSAANDNGFVLRGKGCPNTLFEIGEPFVLPPTFGGFDAQGNASVTLTLQPGRCFVEALAFATCTTSQAIEVP